MRALQQARAQERQDRRPPLAPQQPLAAAAAMVQPPQPRMAVVGEAAAAAAAFIHLAAVRPRQDKAQMVGLLLVVAVPVAVALALRAPMPLVVGSPGLAVLAYRPLSREQALLALVVVVAAAALRAPAGQGVVETVRPMLLPAPPEVPTRAAAAAAGLVRMPLVLAVLALSFCPSQRPIPQHSPVA